MTAPTTSPYRTIDMRPDGTFQISTDPDHVLANFVGMIARGKWAPEIERLFAPDGDGVWVDTLGGAIRVKEREGLPFPFDEDPTIDPELEELWLVQRERRSGLDQQTLLTGKDLRNLLIMGRHLAAGTLSAS